MNIKEWFNHDTKMNTEYFYLGFILIVTLSLTLGMVQALIIDMFYTNDVENTGQMCIINGIFGTLIFTMYVIFTKQGNYLGFIKNQKMVNVVLHLFAITPLVVAIYRLMTWV